MLKVMDAQPFGIHLTAEGSRVTEVSPCWFPADLGPTVAAESTLPALMGLELMLVFWVIL